MRYALDDTTEINPEVMNELFYEVLKDEMDARNWGFTDLDYECECHGLILFELAHKKRPLTDDLAECLAEAFGTSSEYWWNLYNSTNNTPKE